MLKKTILIPIILLLVIVLSGCKKDTSSILDNNCVIDTSRLTYNQDIKPLLETRCGFISTCHGNGSPYGNYTTYQGINIHMSTGVFENRTFILKDMPPQTMSGCDFNKLKLWYDMGHPE